MGRKSNEWGYHRFVFIKKDLSIHNVAYYSKNCRHEKYSCQLRSNNGPNKMHALLIVLLYHKWHEAGFAAVIKKT
jgi:hypothetical protein